MIADIDEFRELKRAERRKSRAVAKAIADAVAAGDVDAFQRAVGQLDVVVDGWRLAFLQIGRLAAVSPDIQEAFLSIWIESKHLSLSVGDRPVLARGLRLLFPGKYQGPSLTVYRGASWKERCKRRYGFSWTTDRTIARNFAGNYVSKSAVAYGLGEGVILRTTAPADAILLVREPEGGYYDEGEVVVDPFRLGRVEVAERLRS